MSDEKVKRVMVKPDRFVKCYNDNAGDVNRVAEILGIKPLSVRMRAHKYIKLGVNIPKPVSTSRKLETKVDYLNSLLS